MVMIPMTEWAATATATVAGAAAFVAGGRKLYAGVKSWDDGMKSRDVALARLSEQITGMNVAIKAILHESQFNGGTSQKDMIALVLDDLIFTNMIRRIAERTAVWEGRIDQYGRTVPVHISPEWTRITGVGLEDAIAGGWARCLHPADRQRVLAAADEADATVQEFSAEYRCVNVLTKHQCVVRHHARPIKSQRGKLLGWYGTLEVLPPSMESTA